MTTKQASVAYLLIFFGINFCVSASEPSAWSEAVIDDFNKTERFFLHSGCRFAFPKIHLYDLESQKWLSPDLANTITNDSGKFIKIDYSQSANPNIEKAQSCIMNISKEELKNYLGKKVNTNKQYLLLFFEAPFSPKDGRSLLEIIDAPFVKKQQKKLKALRAFSDTLDFVQKISIKTSMKGYNSGFGFGFDKSN